MTSAAALFHISVIYPSRCAVTDFHLPSYYAWLLSQAGTPMYSFNILMKR